MSLCQLKCNYLYFSPPVLIHLPRIRKSFISAQQTLTFAGSLSSDSKAPPARDEAFSVTREGTNADIHNRIIGVPATTGPSVTGGSLSTTRY